MKKVAIINKNKVFKYDLEAIKNNLIADTYIWKEEDNERILLKLIRKYNCIIVINDKYLFETISLLKSEKPFNYFKFELKYLEGKFFEKYYPRNNLGKYLKEAFSRKRAGK